MWPSWCRKGGGEIHFGIPVDRIHVEGNRVVRIEGVNEAGERSHYSGDYFFSTMPVRDLVRAFSMRGARGGDGGE